MSVIRLAADASVDEILANIEEHGYCIVENLVSADVIKAMNDEMAPHLAAASFGANEGSGSKTRRVGGLIGRSPAARQLIAHPTLLAVAQRYLGDKASTYQLNCTQVSALHPGQKEQFLHRDELGWDGYPFKADYPIELSTVWALDDFTEENGATRLIPGSHKSDRAPEDYTKEETLAAVMPAGSAIIYSGKLVHGGGANNSQEIRRGALIDYCVGWVRQEENQYLTVPIEVARTLDRDLLRLMGYHWGGPGLGHVRNFEDPIVALFPDEQVGRFTKAAEPA